MASRLLAKSTEVLARHTSRRGFLARSAVVGSALTVAPVRFLVRPGTAYAAVCNCTGSSCECGSLCCDGYTEFCCTLTGANTCPPGTAAGGWWKADGSGLCGDGPRYYLDCNVVPPAQPCSCGCGLGRCDLRRACCTQFRYGQCHPEIGTMGPIMCRVVTCTPPWQFDASCSTAALIDNATRFHDAPCLHETPPVKGPPRLRTGGWYVRYSLDGGAANLSFGYGAPGDIAVVGDWDGDGMESPGVFRDGGWYLRNSNTSGPADLVYSFGDPGDWPVVGRWVVDDPKTYVGVYRNGAFYLRTSHTSGPADLQFGYGVPGDVPIVGDWDGDGVESPGVFRDGAWYLRNTNTPGPADVVYSFGDPGDTPVVGRWIPDDPATYVGVYRNGAFYLRTSHTSGPANAQFGYGVPGDIPLTGWWRQRQSTDAVAVAR